MIQSKNMITGHSTSIQMNILTEISFEIMGNNMRGTHIPHIQDYHRQEIHKAVLVQLDREEMRIR